MLEPRRPDAEPFALRNRVLLARTLAGVDVDIALGALPFEEHSVDRSTLWAIEDNVSLRTCSAEDLIVHKVFAGRGRDWDNVETVLTRQSLNLDWKLIRQELEPLLQLDSLSKLDLLVAKLKNRLS